jgi:two-component system, chemotaxis family, CheB/CheR fusion protein
MAIESNEDILATIFDLLKQQKCVDFTGYKPATLKRRIARRMALHNLDHWQDYLAYLQTHPRELAELDRDLLINVTNFFRDPQTFNALTTKVFPEIIAHTAPEDPIRIWVAGCSTGQEAYSIAICLLEYLAEHSLHRSIKIFATDISDASINLARSGIYKLGLMDGVSPDRLRRFFVPVEGGYQIGKPVRELCIFAKQNLLADPPFSQIDLISCRNVMIYLGAELQKRLIPIFHYALKLDRFLMLGSSESIGDFTNLFAPVDKKSKLYLHKTGLKSPYLRFNSSDRALAKVKPIMPIDEDNHRNLELVQVADRLILDRYAPVGVAIDSDMNIVQFRGQTGAYLEPAIGTPSFNLFKMIRPELLVELRAAIQRSTRQNAIVRQAGIQFKIADVTKLIDIEVIPFKLGTDQQPHFLVLFQELALLVPLLTGSGSAQDQIPSGQTSPGKTRKVKQTEWERENIRIQQELTATREYLQAIIQEQESTNQAVQVANEEILSSNEELQSANEELETSQEELHATNEELHTINEELHSRNFDLGQVNNDLQNLLSSINIPILMLDGELRIRRFTALAQPIFNLIPTDLGRPFSDIQPNILIPNLSILIAETIDTLTTREQEVQNRTGNWYVLRIRPYRTIDNRIDGVVIGLIDIDSIKQAESQCQTSLAEKEVLLREIHHRVKNNLQIVSSLLSLQSNRSENTQISAILQDSQDRVQAMALIHEILYQSTNLAALNFGEYLHTLVQNLFASHSIDRSAISLVVNVQAGLIIDVDRAVLCGLIISELVTNALNHGFGGNRQGEIAVELTTRVDQLIQLSVANNGQELPADFDIDQIRSMGLNLVKSLVKQIKGELLVKTGATTTFNITFPIPN